MPLSEQERAIHCRRNIALEEAAQRVVLPGGLVPVPPRLRGSAQGLAGCLHQVEPAQSPGTDCHLSEILHLEREERVGDLPPQCACELSRLGWVLRCGCECGPGVVISGRRQQTLTVHKYK